MNRYVGTKIIHAEEQMKDGKDGYKVIYTDGYESWSPKDVFEDAYRRCDYMTFGLALELLKKGKKVARKGWNGKEQYIELAKRISYASPQDLIINADHQDIGNCAIAFVGTRGVQLGWLASQADMLAEDWVLID